jgi:hypothetical protein
MLTYASAYTDGTGVNAQIFTDPGINGRDAEGHTHFRAGVYDSVGKAKTFAKKYNISNAEGVALLFLHELSHATGKYIHPENVGHVKYESKVIEGDDLNDQIYENCFKPQRK